MLGYGSLMKIGRNDPCHCGSGNKYKKCCIAKDTAAHEAELAAQAEARKNAEPAEEVAAVEAPTRAAAAKASALANNPRGHVGARQPTNLPRRRAV